MSKKGGKGVDITAHSSAPPKSSQSHHKIFSTTTESSFPPHILQHLHTFFSSSTHSSVPPQSPQSQHTFFSTSTHSSVPPQSPQSQQTFFSTSTHSSVLPHIPHSHLSFCFFFLFFSLALADFLAGINKLNFLFLSCGRIVFHLKLKNLNILNSNCSIQLI